MIEHVLLDLKNSFVKICLYLTSRVQNISCDYLHEILDWFHISYLYTNVTLNVMFALLLTYADKINSAYLSFLKWN